MRGRGFRERQNGSERSAAARAWESPFAKELGRRLVEDERQTRPCRSAPARAWDSPFVTELVRRVNEDPRAAVLATTGALPADTNSSVQAAIAAEMRCSRTKHGWCARWRALATMVSIAEAYPDLGSERLAIFADVFDNAVTALSDRDLVPENVFQDLYASMSGYLPAESIEVDPLAGLLARCPYPIARIARELNRTITPSSLQILERRPGHTLQEIAADLGLTRERIRQIERKADQQAMTALLQLAPELAAFWRQALAKAVVSERDLIHPFVETGEAGKEQIRLGRSLLRAVGAVEPRVMKEAGLAGYWTLEADRLATIAKELETVLPCTSDQLDEILDEMDFTEARALKELFLAGWGQYRLHQSTGYWVRSGSQDRDAAWLVLMDEEEPLAADDLGFRIGLTARNLTAQLWRDPRFVQVKPSGEWALASARPRQAPSTALEATLECLRRGGPLSLAELTDRVQEIYPVTAAAVSGCVNHYLIGVTAAGLLDLVENGATRRRRKEPRIPEYVTLESSGRLKITRPIDTELMRGSGVGVSPYVSWFLGLESAPSSRRFEIGGSDTIRVTYRTSGSTLSSLRTLADRLGGRVGCLLTVTLDPGDNRASARLECSNHHHNGSID
jgi:transcriptional regulator with XRE-family HTH domain